MISHLLKELQPLQALYYNKPEALGPEKANIFYINFNTSCMELVNTSIEQYAREHTRHESALVQELVTASDQELEYIDMLSGRIVGRFLSIMVKLTGAKRILEIGTFTGYSALCMAEALPDDGELITCEYNERYEDIARSFFQRNEVSHKVRLEMGSALDTIGRFDEPFDLVYLDADKANYPNYYRAVIPMLRQGGLFIADNVLWSGAVLNPDDEKALAIDQMNKLIREDERVENVLLTVRDGLQIVRKL